MKRGRVGRRGLVLLAVVALTARGEDWLDRTEQALTWGGADWGVHASGTAELEGYRFTGPAPGLIDTANHDLGLPRLTLFLDAQAGASLYVFAQARLDRGFDPAAAPLRGRLDEYAVRWTPWADGRLNVQAGKFATVVGSWVGRHDAWENAFVTAPLAYENLTGVWDALPASSADVVLAWAHVRPATDGDPDEKYLRLPVIWGPDYASGVAVTGALGDWEYAAELKNGALSARPETWDVFATPRTRPTVSGRLGWRPDPRWNLGLSLSDGTYLRGEAAAALPAGRRLGEYRETVVGPDLGFAWHHVQLWSEWFWARFTVPGLGDLRTVTGYVESRIKFTPRWAGAVRVNWQEFSDVVARDGARLPWGRELWRLDLAPAFRFTPQIQLKLQYSWQHEQGAPHPASQLVATQLTVKF